MNKTELQQAAERHDARVRELLTANNREVGRRRALRTALEAIAHGRGGAPQRRARSACDADDQAAKN